MLSTILACILFFALTALLTTFTISMIFTIIEDRKQAKRNEDRELRDIEYHEKRMKDFK